ncbi:MAG: aminotransferase class V-fold PLP-dependent enzyme [Gemmatimonadota bacterium]|nr:MAG: aminotransferase class V-fold PLP-dependent enzyme [Gemmatimonadota bacterium]
MSDCRDRRCFLRDVFAGTAAAAAGPGLAATLDIGTGQPSRFADAWRTAHSDQGRWRAVREQFLLEPGYVYLNTAGLGPTPLPVIETVDREWRELELRCETGHARRDEARRRGCEFLNCGEDEFALTRSATEGMNLVARGVRLDAGSEVLMTTHEHPGGAMPWFGVAEEHDILIRTFEPGSGGADTMDRLVAALTPRTRVVMLCHVTCTLGTILPIKEIADVCRDRGILSVIDGAQAPGQIPVDLHALGCDFYVASGHKFLLAPKGTGFLYVRDEMLDRWRPTYVGAYSDAGFDLASGRFERRREAVASEYGTRNTPLVLGFGAALEFIETIGLDHIVARGASLARRLRGHLETIDGVEVLTPADSSASAAILAFRLPESGGDPWDWCNLLRRESGIRLRPVGEAGLMAVRASTHLFNREDEVDRLAEILRELV